MEPTEKIKALEAEIKELKDQMEKANRKLSKASLARIEACTDHMGKAMDELKALVSDGVVVDDDDVSDGVEKPRKSIDLATMTVDELNEYLRSNGGESIKE